MIAQERQNFRMDDLAEHLSLDEVKLKIWSTSGFLKVQKWLVVYNAIVDPRPVSEIARHTGLSEGTVHTIIAEYHRLGPEAIDVDRRFADTLSR